MCSSVTYDPVSGEKFADCSICVDCMRCAPRYRERNKEKVAAYQREYYERNKEKLAAGRMFP